MEWVDWDKASAVLFNDLKPWLELAKSWWHKKGPRQRSDRKARKLSDGGTADVYESVLKGLSELAPGLSRVNYEKLRTALKTVLQSEDVPQAHEVSRVLERMSEIASSDEASTPVLDWDKEERELHITDPFFAFFLKWGMRG